MKKLVGAFRGKCHVELIDGLCWIIHNEDKSFKFSLVTGETVIPRDKEITDFASIPRVFWRLIGPPTGAGKGANYGPAAIIHDELYKLHHFENGIPCERKFADMVFYAAMCDLKVDLWRRKLMYLAVRIGGKKHFTKHTKSDILIDEEDIIE